jgi:hypothetical protein
MALRPRAEVEPCARLLRFRDGIVSSVARGTCEEDRGPSWHGRLVERELFTGGAGLTPLPCLPRPGHAGTIGAAGVLASIGAPGGHVHDDGSRARARRCRLRLAEGVTLLRRSRVHARGGDGSPGSCLSPDRVRARHRGVGNAGSPRPEGAPPRTHPPRRPAGILGRSGLDRLKGQHDENARPWDGAVQRSHRLTCVRATSSAGTCRVSGCS